MNRIYSKIWNKSLGQLVVASELASNDGAASSGAAAGVSKLGRLSALASAMALAFLLQGLSFASHASTYPVGDGSAASCTSATSGTVGRLGNPGATNAQPTDGSGTYSNIVGCNASGNKQTAASVFGSFSQVTGTGGSVFGFDSSAAKWASAYGLETAATGTGSTALGFGSNATAANSVAIGGAGGNGTTALSVANSTTASGAGAIAIGSNATKGAQASASDAIAIGGQSVASGSATVALGLATSASGTDAIALGHNATAASGALPSIAIGSGANAASLGSTNLAIGDNASATGTAAGQGDSTAIGTNAQATGQDSTAVGGQTTASGTNTLAIGNNGTSATGTNATAFGVAANAGANNASAMGYNAQATNANSVAVGANSVTSAPHTGTTGLYGSTAAAPASATNGTLSVGAANAERQVQNVAAGVISSTSTDAINGSQLAGVSQGVNALGTAVAGDLGGGATYDATTGKVSAPSYAVYGSTQTNVGAAISALQTKAPVQYSTAAAPTTGTTTPSNDVTLVGSTAGSAVKLHNVAAGMVSSTSTDAVNGAQLNAVNTTASKGWNLSANGGTAVNVAPGGTVNVAQGSSGNIAVTQSGTNLTIDTNPNLTATSVTTGNTVMNNAGVTVSGGANGPVSLSNTGLNNGGNKLSNVAAGTVSSTSTDAVNGSQLNATNTNVTNLGNSISNGAVGPVQYANTATPTTPNGGTKTNDVTLVGAAAGTVGLHNVTAGTVSSTSTDAVNGSQLNTTNQNVAAVSGNVNNLGTTTASDLGGGATYDPATGKLSAPSYTTYNANGTTSTVNNVGAALTAINTTGIKYFHTNSTAADSQATGTNSVAIGPSAVASGASDIALGLNSKASSTGSDTNIALGANSVANGSSLSTAAYNPGLGTLSGTTPVGEVSVGSAGSERRITNVAAGANATDAVNVSQLQSAVIGAVGSVDALNWDPTANGGAGAWNANHKGAGPNKIVNVAAGTVSSTSTDAVNGSQLNTTNQNVAAVTGNVNNLGTTTASDLGGGATYDATTGKVSAPSYAVYGSTQTNVGAAISALQTKAPVQYSTAAAPTTGTTTPSNDVTLVGSTAGSAVKLHNVAAGMVSSTSTDAVNGAQLNAVNATASKGWNLSANGGTAVNVAPGGTVNVAQGSSGNIAVTQSGTNLTIDTNPNLTATSVTTGNTVMNNAGVTVSGGANGPVSLGNTGLNNGGNKLSNVAAGTVSSTSTDAVNGSQLNTTNQNVAAVSGNVNNLGTTTASDLGGGATYDPTTGKLSAPSYTTYNANGTTSTANNVGAALTAINTTGIKYFHTNSTAADSQATGSNSVAIGPSAVASGASDIALGLNSKASSTGSDTNLALGANSVANGSTLGTAAYNPGAGTLSGTTPVGEVSVGSAGNERRITNVAAGANATDAVNVSQLQSAVTGAVGSIDALNWDPTANGGAGAWNANHKGAGPNKIVNVAAGTVSSTSTDAVNGSQLKALATGVDALGTSTASTLGSGTTYDPTTGSISGFSQPINGVTTTGLVTASTAQTTVAGALTLLNANVDNVANVAVKYDSVGGNTITLGATGGTGAPAGGVKVTNVAAGVVSSTSTDAVNGSQLNTTNQNVAAVTSNVNNLGTTTASDLGGGATYDATTGKVSAPSYAVYGSTQTNVDAAISALQTKAPVQYSTAAAPTTGTTTPSNDVTLVGSTAGSAVKLHNVAAGAVSSTSTDAVNGAQLNAVNATASKGWNLSANGGTAVNVAPGSTVNVAQGSSGNIAVTQSGTNLMIDTNPNLTATSVTTGNTVMNNAGVTVSGGANGPVSLSNTGLNNGGNKLSNVAAGTVSSTSTDAVNGSQLNTTNQNVAAVTSNVNNLGTTTASDLGGGATYDATTGKVSAPSYAVYGSTQTNVGAAISALQTKAPVQYSTAAAPTTGTITPSNDVTLVGSTAGSAVKLHNVAAGAVSSTSTDAINGSQLNTTNQNVAAVSGNVNNLGTTTANDLGGGATYDPTTGKLSAPSYTTYNANGTTGTASNVGAALTAINTTGIKYFHTNSTAADSQATGTNSVAIGPSAVASGASDIALGLNSKASSTGSDTNLALGANSVANGSSLSTAAYNPGLGTLSGTTPVGEVSVGSAGSERRITNVAAGANATDAVNVSQLQSAVIGAVGSVDALNWDPTANGGAGAWNANHKGAGPNKIVNVAAGTVSSTSTDAVNGSQLNTTNQNVAAVTSNVNNLGTTTASDLGGGATYDATTGKVSAPSYAVYGSTQTNVGAAISALQTKAPVQYSTAAAPTTGTTTPSNDVTLVGSTAGSAVKLHNVAAGTVSSTSTDAVNGAQLNAVNTTASKGWNLSANGGTAVNVAPGGTVNVAQGSSGNIAVTQSGTNLTIDTNPNLTATSVTTGNTVMNNTGVTVSGGANGPVSLGNTGLNNGGNKLSNVAAGTVSSTSTDAVNGSQLNATNQAIGTLTQGAVQYDKHPDGTPNYGSVTLAGPASTDGGVTGGTKLTNVAQGALSSTSTDAVNGSQLNATNTAVAGVTSSVSNLGNSTASNLGGGSTYDPATGTVSAPSYTTYNADGTTSTASNVGAALDAINTTGIKYFHANSTNPDSQAIGTDSVAIGPSAVASNAGDVALGSGSTTAAAVGTASGTINGTTYAYAGTTPTSTVSVGSAGNERTITNVAAGRVNSSSTDAVNGSQLDATNQALGTLAQTTGTADKSNVKYDANPDGTPNYGSVTLAGPASTDGGVTGGTKLTNVAQGTLSSTSTDAVNGSQLNATNTAVAGVTSSVSNLGNSTASNLGGGSTYDPATGTVSAPSYTTYNADGTTGTASNVGAALDAINTTGIKYFHANSTNPDSQALGSNSVAIGPNAVASNAGDVALGSGSTTAAAVPTANGTINGATYVYAGTSPTSTVSVGSAGNERTITNVAAGRVSSSSTDAINGSQLDATNQALGTLAQTTSAADKSNVKYDANPDGTPNYGSVTLAGPASTDGGVTGGTKLTNVAQGTLSSTSTDAVNGAQLYATNQTISSITNGGGIKYFHVNAPTSAADSQALGASSIAIGPDSVASGDSSYAAGNDAQAVTADSIAIGHGSTADGGSAVAIGAGNAAYGTGAVATGSAGYASGTGAFTGGANNIANGDGSQSATAANQANGAVAIGNGNTAIGQGSVALGNASTAGGAGAVALGDTATAAASNGVAIGSGAKATNAGDVALGAGSTTSAAVGVSSATVNGVTYGGFAGTTPTSAVSIGSAGNERQLQNVAAGQVTATSTDAVNGSQLYSVASQVSQVGNQVNQNTAAIQTNTQNIQNLQNGSAGMFQVSPDANGTAPTASGTQSTAGGNGAVASGAGATALGNGSTASGDGSTAVGSGAQAIGANSVAIGAGSVATTANSVSVGSAGNTRTITNVSAGTAPTDAVNVSQLQASTAGAVHYDTNADGSLNTSSLTLGGGGASTTATTIHNVNAGTANTDAVNVGQLNQGITTAENWSKNYTDQQFQSVNKNLNTIGNRANAGVASAIAAASLPQAYQPGQNSAAVSLGNFHGETGIAVGVSTITENGRYIFKVNATSDTRGDTGVGVGAAMVW